jgi:hypothetical protein
MMEVTCSSEMSVDFQWTRKRHIPEDITLYIVQQIQTEQDFSTESAKTHYMAGRQEACIGMAFECVRFLYCEQRVHIHGPMMQ